MFFLFVAGHKAGRHQLPLRASGNFHTCMSFVCSFSTVIIQIAQLNTN